MITIRDGSRGARRRARAAALSDLLDGLPTPIQDRAHELRRARGDLALSDVAELARELHDPATAAIAEVAARLLHDRNWTSVADAKTAARLILAPIATAL